ncbi:MAG: serine/threonine-protein phosphatase [Phycisphaerales bacterium]|nr:MAG: serine/threonine-protein phosphatase [Phycisphaerales bacterium]
MSDLPYPMSSHESSATRSIGDGLLSVLESMAGHLTDLEQKSRELTANYQHLDEQIHLASQIQRALLPDAGHGPRGARVSTLYRPVDRVSGDIYDIVRLDETNVGISLADAAGHGVPAALLTVFIKRVFKGKEIHAGSYRIVPPDEILNRLNRELNETRLKHCPYVTALHAVYSEHLRRLTFARGGTPYPVLIPAGGAPRQLISRGGLIGAFDGGDFECVDVDLHPGDRILFFTDGLTALLCGSDGAAPGDDITRIPWFAEFAQYPFETFLTRIDRLIDETPPGAWHGDDITVVAMEVEN